MTFKEMTRQIFDLAIPSSFEENKRYCFTSEKPWSYSFMVNHMKKMLKGSDSCLWPICLPDGHWVIRITHLPNGQWDYYVPDSRPKERRMIQEFKCK